MARAATAGAALRRDQRAVRPRGWQLRLGLESLFDRPNAIVHDMQKMSGTAYVPDLDFLAAPLPDADHA